jgi:phage shock protein PspC (stress-responsive transcriptional regulator)
VLWALTIFVGGLGVIIYIIMWIVMPVAQSSPASGAD